MKCLFTNIRKQNLRNLQGFYMDTNKYGNFQIRTSVPLTHTVYISITCIEFFRYFINIYRTITQLSCINRINVTKMFRRTLVSFWEDQIIPPEKESLFTLISKVFEKYKDI